MYVYLGILVYVQLVFVYLLEYLLPPTNGINHDSSVAMQNYKVVLQHWPNIQYFAASSA